MTDVMDNVNLDEFEKEMSAQTIDEFEKEMNEQAVVAKAEPEVLLTSNEDEEGFAGLFADWDLIPEDVF